MPCRGRRGGWGGGSWPAPAKFWLARVSLQWLQWLSKSGNCRPALVASDLPGPIWAVFQGAGGAGSARMSTRALQAVVRCALRCAGAQPRVAGGRACAFAIRDPASASAAGSTAWLRQHATGAGSFTYNSSGGSSSGGSSSSSESSSSESSSSERAAAAWHEASSREPEQGRTQQGSTQQDGKQPPGQQQEDPDDDEEDIPDSDKHDFAVEVTKMDWLERVAVRQATMGLVSAPLMCSAAVCPPPLP